MSIALVPGTMSHKAFETIDLLKSRMDAGPEKTTNSQTAYEKVLIKTRLVADIIFFGTFAGLIYTGAKALTSRSVTTLRNFAGCITVMLVFSMYIKFFSLPYLKESNLVHSSKSTLRNFINNSHDSWKQDLFQKSGEDSSLSSKTLKGNAFKEFLLCLRAKEGTKEAKRGSNYLTFLNMSKEEAIKAVAITKLVYNIHLTLEYVVNAYKYYTDVSSQRAQLSLTEISQKHDSALPLIKKNAIPAVQLIEEDLGLLVLEPELEKRVRYILNCVKNDLDGLVRQSNATSSVKLSEIDRLYHNSNIEPAD